jgi:hypothetical protein
MKAIIKQTTTRTARPKLGGMNLAVLLFVGVLAVDLVIAQPDYTQKNPDLSLSLLNQRADFLSQITDPIQRDQNCIGLSAMGRQLDKALAPDARIFISGMLGPTNASKSGYFFFLRNYLFPRDLEISLNTNVICAPDGFEGTPCDSPAELQTNGFDLLIRSENNFDLVPLTKKGLPK